MTKRRIQTFGRRLGKMTKGQQRAIEHHEGRLCLLDHAFPDAQSSHYTLEIGFGMGDGLIKQAEQNPHVTFIGVEVYAAGVGACLRQAKLLDLNNIFIYHQDIYDVFNIIPSRVLNTVQVYFPDPWPKKRHHKRRLLNPSFLAALSPKLADGAVLRVATDDLDYAEVVNDLIKSCKSWRLLEGDRLKSHCQARCLSKYAARAQRLGHTITDIVAQYTLNSSET